jgi:hypothetical protein
MEQALSDNMVLFGYQISPIIMTGLRIVLIVVAGWIILILIQKLMIAVKSLEVRDKS